MQKIEVRHHGMCGSHCKNQERPGYWQSEREDHRQCASVCSRDRTHESAGLRNRAFLHESTRFQDSILNVNVIDIDANYPDLRCRKFRIFEQFEEIFRRVSATAVSSISREPFIWTQAFKIPLQRLSRRDRVLPRRVRCISGVSKLKYLLDDDHGLEISLDAVLLCKRLWLKRSNVTTQRDDVKMCRGFR